jgi:hypothetical protein
MECWTINNLIGAGINDLRTRRLSVPTPSVPSPGTGGGAYFDTGSGHWIEDTGNDGTVITLEDGSLWLISPLSRVDTSLWLDVDNITVLRGGSPGYGYRLINTDEDGEIADARFLGMG